MRVFNLTERPLDYRGRTIPPSGGFLDFQDLAFIPDRDLRLQTERVLAFGSLPVWFETRQRIRRVAELAERVTLTPMPMPNIGIPTLSPEEFTQVQPDDTLVPVPAEPSLPLVEKKIGRRKKTQQ